MKSERNLKKKSNEFRSISLNICRPSATNGISTFGRSPFEQAPCKQALWKQVLQKQVSGRGFQGAGVVGAGARADVIGTAAVGDKQSGISRR